MSSHKSKSLKLQEFYAHSDTVNTASIGTYSSYVFATGADDCKVNVWKVGKHAPLLTLPGHKTEVDCVKFDGGLQKPEEYVAAGSRSGSIILWQLNEAKVARNLSGHRASVSCMDFHPYGAYLATGSHDCSIKIWDVNSKHCMKTYKGHAGHVTCIKHSPDGRLIVSGDSTGVVKVWDLTAGKLLKELSGFGKSAGVSGLDFHPNEFLLACASDDKCVNFWDMESYQLVGQTPRQANPIRNVLFEEKGRCLLSSCADSLKVWKWEPETACLDAVDVAWPTIAEMAVSRKEELIAVGFSKAVVSVYLVHLPQLNPFNQPLVMDGPPTQDSLGDFASALTPSAASSSSSRFDDLGATLTSNHGSAIAFTPAPGYSSPTSVPSGSPRSVTSQASANSFSTSTLLSLADSADQTPTAHTAIDLRLASAPAPAISLSSSSFQSHLSPVASPAPQLIPTPALPTVSRQSSLTHTPSTVSPAVAAPAPAKSAAVTGQATVSGDRPAGGGVWPSHGRRSASAAAAASNPLSSPPPESAPKSSWPMSSPATRQRPVPDRSESSTTGISARSPAVSSVSARSQTLAARPESARVPAPSTNINLSFGSKTLPDRDVPPANVIDVDSVTSSSARFAAEAPRSVDPIKPTSSIMASFAEKIAPEPVVEPRSSGISLSDFGSPSAQRTAAQDRELDQETRARVQEDHLTVVGVLTQRLQNIKILGALWASGKVKEMLVSMSQMDDTAAACDVLSLEKVEHSATGQNGWLTLELAAELLPAVKQLLAGKFDNYQLVGLKYTRIVLTAFGHIIKDSRKIVGPTGVDLHRDERLLRCQACADCLKALQPLMQNLLLKHHAVAALAREVKTQLDRLFD